MSKELATWAPADTLSTLSAETLATEIIALIHGPWEST